MKYGREGEGQTDGSADKHAAGSCALANCISAVDAAKPESTANEVNKPLEGCRNKAIKCSDWKRETRPDKDPRSLKPYGHEPCPKISRFHAPAQEACRYARREVLDTDADVSADTTWRAKSVGRTAKKARPHAHAQTNAVIDFKA